MEIKSAIYNDDLWCKVADYAENCSWRAGKKLAELMRNNYFEEWERIFAAIDMNEIIGFCALTKDDCIPNVPYTPYVSFVFVGEGYRGYRLSEKLCKTAILYARKLGFEKVYLISDHINLYEKYGFIRIDEKQAPWGSMETIFMYTV